jgi:DTW domain
MADNAEEAMVRFLEECSLQVSSSRFLRERCETCSGSRSVYCFECCKLLIPRSEWPSPIRDGTLRLPFDVDIVLNDRRSSATGVQLQTVMRAVETSMIQTATTTLRSGSCQLYDIDQGDVIPDYANHTEGTFLLFPGEDSTPLSSLVNDSCGSKPVVVKKLVVLDCKWSKSSDRFHPSLLNLPRVHLDRVPKHSYYWRWHNAGEGMLSTIEAIYFSAWQLATVRPDFSTSDRDNLVYMLWLFGLQREIIQTKYREQKVRRYKHETGVPFLEDAKEFQRSLRAKQRLEREQTAKNGALHN